MQTQHTVDAAFAAAGSKATYTGSGMVLSGWFFSSEFAVFVGIVIGILGFLVNWYYRHKLTNTEIRFKLDELHLKQEQNEREKLEHKARMTTMRTRVLDHTDCNHEAGICVHLERQCDKHENDNHNRDNHNRDKHEQHKGH